MKTKRLHNLFLVIVFLIAGSFPVYAETIFAPPIPTRIGGTLTVDSVQITQDTDDVYTITVTKKNGSDYGPKAEDTDGLNSSEWYLIDIPIYDSTDQTGGAKEGDTAVIHLYKSGVEYYVSSPSNGIITVGKTSETTQIDITAFEITDTALPVPKSIKPKKGSLGKKITVQGKKFGTNEGNIILSKGKKSITADKIFSWKNTKIVFTCPWGTTTGNNKVYVQKLGDYTSKKGLNFKFIAPKPKISKVSGEIKNGNTVVVKGNNFGDEQTSAEKIISKGISFSVAEWTNKSVTLVVEKITNQKKMSVKVKTVYGQSKAKKLK